MTGHVSETLHVMMLVSGTGSKLRIQLILNPHLLDKSDRQWSKGDRARHYWQRIMVHLQTVLNNYLKLYDVNCEIAHLFCALILIKLQGLIDIHKKHPLT